MNSKARVMFVCVILIAAVIRAKADFYPLEASRNAVRNYRLEGETAGAPVARLMPKLEQAVEVTLDMPAKD
jgi:hypothetical protein